MSAADSYAGLPRTDVRDDVDDARHDGEHDDVSLNMMIRCRQC